MRTLVSCFFDARVNGPFARMARVLEYSYRHHGDICDVRISRLSADMRRPRTGVEAHAHNTQKLEHWVSEALAMPDGSELILVDADVMVLRPIADIWEQAFDVAYTVKAEPLPPSAPFPFNLGVMFLRMSEPVRGLLSAWLRMNADLFAMTPTDARVWRRTHGGINQAAFGMIVERGALDGLKVLTLPCAEWNCEESAWDTFDPDRTRIVHVKGELRRELFQACRPKPALEPLIQRWRGLDKAAGQIARTA